MYLVILGSVRGLLLTRGCILQSPIQGRVCIHELAFKCHWRGPESEQINCETNYKADHTTQ